MPADPFKYDGVLDDWKSSQILRFCKASALDVGCNTGALVAFLQSRQIAAEGIDISESLIATARRTYPEYRFRCGTDLSVYRDGQVESVIAWNVLEHIDDDAAALRHMMRIASRNVILSIPKEDDISLPDSRVTYRPYVDPTHRHYYTRDVIRELVGRVGTFPIHFEDTTRVRPLLAYKKLGMPHWLCAGLDNLFWALGANKDFFRANLMAVIDVSRR